MSYDIVFLRREPGQSWEDAINMLEGQDDAPTNLARPPDWDQVVAGVRTLLGEVSVLASPPAWEIYHEPTGIQVSCFSGEWSITVPYWSVGHAASKIAGDLRGLSAIVHASIGLDPYDPQVGDAVLSDLWTPERAALVFDQVAESFKKQGITRG
ncbi:hypothetical protein [Pseudofrankia sp. BMG5.37]|uniref:hypothetical protein n=1 Tax=Pseudofrankia sp. BMG5.37 TaxID=3050035 RepID=UPI002893EC24|nr:hypothetical protein [Pseudofrankia sp. BMG5.37]MDT3446775.1 hypothetical protein [Pseudofrankia sp. BMG5.37]